MESALEDLQTIVYFMYEPVNCNRWTDAVEIRGEIT